MGGQRRAVLCEIGDARGEPIDGVWQLADAAAGEILLVGVVLLQDGQALSSASASASVSTAGLPEAMAFTSA